MSPFLELLNDWNATGPEIQALADLSLTLGRIDEQSEDATASVVIMDRIRSGQLTSQGPPTDPSKDRAQGAASRDRIGNPVGQLQRQVVDDERVTAQLHVFRVGDTANPVSSTAILDGSVPRHWSCTFRNLCGSGS